MIERYKKDIEFLNEIKEYEIVKATDTNRCNKFYIKTQRRENSKEKVYEVKADFPYSIKRLPYDSEEYEAINSLIDCMDITHESTMKNIDDFIDKLYDTK